MTIHVYDANAWLQMDFGHIHPAKTSARFIYENAMAATDPQIWVWDGANPNARRRELFPGYKIRDHSGREDIFAGLRLMREILSHSRSTQISVPEWEADDVCGTIARYMADAGQQVTIHTNDFDYHQLRSHPLIRIEGVPLNPLPPRLVPLYKSMVGDRSDKIPGIPGFAQKSWEAFAGIHDQLDAAFQAQDRDWIRAQPFKPKTKTWIAEDENIDLLFVYYRITQLWEVPLDLIDQHTEPGVPNWEAANELFRKFML